MPKPRGGRLYSGPQFQPAAHPCGAEKPDGSICQTATRSWGYCGECTKRHYDVEDAKLQQSRRDAMRQDRLIRTTTELRMEGIDMDSKALMATTEQGMMQRIERAKFPQALQPEEKRTLALAALTYGFDPLMGELTIFQGRPYVSIDGRYRKARETGKLDGVRTRPATKQEREDWSIPVEDFFFKAEVFVKGCSMPFEGWGRVRAGERTDSGKFKPVDVNPQRMAEKRAEAQALRKAFSIPLPSAEDIGIGEETGLPEINTATGEVIDGECREVLETGPLPGDVPNPPPPPPPQNAAPAQPCAAEPAKSRPPGLITDAQLAEFKGMDWEKASKNPKYKHFTSLDDFAAYACPGGLDALTEKQAAAWLKSLKG